MKIIFRVKHNTRGSGSESIAVTEVQDGHS